MYDNIQTSKRREKNPIVNKKNKFCCCKEKTTKYSRLDKGIFRRLFVSIIRLVPVIPPNKPVVKGILMINKGFLSQL